MVSLGSQADGGYLAIRNEEGRLAGYLSVENYGARLIMSNNEETGAVALFGQEEGGGINIYNEHTSIELWTDREGSEIRIHNKPFDPIIKLSVSAQDGQIAIKDKDGTVLFSR